MLKDMGEQMLAPNSLKLSDSGKSTFLFVVVRGTRVYVCAYGNQKTMPVAPLQAPSVDTWPLTRHDHYPAHRTTLPVSSTDWPVSLVTLLRPGARELVKSTSPDVLYDLNSVLSTHVKQLTAACNSNSRGSNVLF